MAQQWSTLATLPEDTGSVLSPQRLTTIRNSNSRRSDTFWPMWAIHTFIVQRHTCRQNTHHIHIKTIKLKLYIWTTGHFPYPSGRNESVNTFKQRSRLSSYLLKCWRWSFLCCKWSWSIGAVSPPKFMFSSWCAFPPTPPPPHLNVKMNKVMLWNQWWQMVQVAVPFLPERHFHVLRNAQSSLLVLYPCPQSLLSLFCW